MNFDDKYSKKCIKGAHIITENDVFIFSCILTTVVLNWLIADAKSIAFQIQLFKIPSPGFSNHLSKKLNGILCWIFSKENFYTDVFKNDMSFYGIFIS